MTRASGFRSRAGDAPLDERTKKIIERAASLPVPPSEPEKAPPVDATAETPIPASSQPIEPITRPVKDTFAPPPSPVAGQKSMRMRTAMVTARQEKQEDPVTTTETGGTTARPTLPAATKAETQEKREKTPATKPVAPPSAVARRQAEERAVKTIRTTKADIKRIGEVLLERNLVSEHELILALSEQSYTKEKLGDILIRLGFIKKNTLINLLMHLNPESLIGNQELETEIPPQVLLDTKTAVFGDAQGVIYVATLNNPDDVYEILQKYTTKKIHFVEIAHRAIIDQLRETEKRTKNVTLLGNEEDASRVFTGILREALGKNASDIHLDPGERVTYVRLRIDGTMHFVDRLLPSLATKVVALIKNRSNLDVSSTRKAQDGSFSLDGRDYRVATLPIATGEKITIRILDRDKSLMDMASLGLTVLDEWAELARQQNGLILVCGATGSGKTTTLYSTIQYTVDKLGETVFTVEDPIEYRLPFVNQTQINEEAGVTFDSFLRTVLRHDPDNVVVGEIRDEKTCEKTLHLADTGHLVYATLHTNDVLSTLTRLKGLGAEDMYLDSMLRGILVQRLAKKFCASCNGQGCHECQNTGKRGRTLVVEFCRLLERGDIERLKNGDLKYHTFLDDARHKLTHNITDREELARVLNNPRLLDD